jgi:hypothetical protein
MRLTVDELFNKLKSIEIYQQSRAKIENPTNSSMALVSSSGGSSANPSPTLFSLTSLMSITKEKVEELEDDKLVLVINQFKRFHDNRTNRR